MKTKDPTRRVPHAIRCRMAGRQTRWEAFAEAMQALMPLWRVVGILIFVGVLSAAFWVLWAVTPVS